MFGRKKELPVNQPFPESKPEQAPPPLLTPFKIVKFFIFILLITIVLAFTLYHISGPFLRTELQNYLDKTVNTKIRFEDIGFNIITRSIVLENITVKNPSEFGKENLLEIKQIKIKVEILPLLEKKLIVSRVSIDNLNLNLYKLEKGATNWDPLWPKKEIPDDAPPKILPVKEFLIKNSVLNYTIQFESGKKATAIVQGIFLYLKNRTAPLSYIENVPLFTEIKGRGYFPSDPKGTISILGNMNIFERQKSFLGNIIMEHISLTYFNDFYPDDSKVKVTEGNFSLNSQLQCIRGQLTLKPDVTVYNLHLKLMQNYETGNVFKLPVLLVIDFFDLYKEEFKFSFEVDGSLDNPQFHLDNVISEKLSEVISESITRTITESPGILKKLGNNTLDALKQLGKPFEELIKGLKGE